jgi:hypothetical protein
MKIHCTYFFSCTVSEIFIERIFSWILGTVANVSRQEFFVGFFSRRQIKK